MSILGFFLSLVSRLPFWVLHRFSDIVYFWIYHVFGYRKKVVWENLKGSFPEKSDAEILEIQKKFYRNFCDLMFESIKTFTISREELKERCRFTPSNEIHELYASNTNLVGLSSHMGNWEWLSLSLSTEFPHEFFAVYKPLSNTKINDYMVRSRMRFGAIFIPIKKIRDVFQAAHTKPYLLGLLSDQAPHDYTKAFEIDFLNRKTFFFPGAGVLSIQKNLVPVWGWIKRVGRSRYEWGMEVLDAADAEKLNPSMNDQDQIDRIARSHHLSVHEAARAVALTKVYAHKLEEKIKMAPQDWLWSHRRWKSR